MHAFHRCELLSELSSMATRRSWYSSIGHFRVSLGFLQPTRCLACGTGGPGESKFSSDGTISASRIGLTRHVQSVILILGIFAFH